MDKAAFDARYGEYRQAVEEYLEGLFSDKPHWVDLYDAMRYSLLAGGKRLRPVLVLETARLCGLEWRVALPVACAVELVHTYSLIHDDLPCMDDDDLRRGKPTNHKVYGQTLAVLAGDALQPEAFRLILTAPGLDAARRADCALLLAQAAGADGMVAGQVLDTLHSPRTREELLEVHSLKTGALLRGAALMGCAAAGAEESLRAALGSYARELGVAFQIRDDMLDVMGDEANLGKTLGSDKADGKTTYVDLLGLEGCKNVVRMCTVSAKAALARLPEHEFLDVLADSLAERIG